MSLLQEEKRVTPILHLLLQLHLFLLLRYDWKDYNFMWKKAKTKKLDKTIFRIVKKLIDLMLLSF